MTFLIILGVWSFIIAFLMGVFRYIHRCDDEMHALMYSKRLQANGRAVTTKRKQVQKQGRGVRAGYFKPFTAGSPGAINISHL
ncbi:MAG: hypothetical protein WEF53_10425 [Bacteroidota bacterium]